MADPVRILHAHSTFSLGGKEARAVRLMNAFGDAASHVVLSATDQFDAREAIDPGVDVAFPADAPSLVGKPSPGRYRKLARYMAQFDLVLTYNWGAMDAVGARRLFGRRLGVPPLIHAEDGFNEDEAVRQKPARVMFRRLMLKAAHKVVVPSQTLERIARTIWRQPEGRVERIPNGIPVGRYAAPATRTIPGLEKRPEQVVIGTLAGLRAVKNLPFLVESFGTLVHSGDPYLNRALDLVIVGEGPDREEIETAMVLWGADHAILPGFLPDPASYVGRFDIFALSSKSEQFPISLVEAMAAGIPAVCTAVGDVADMVSPENRPFIVDPADKAEFLSALKTLACDPALRRAIGEANRQKALQEYDERVMISRYAALYGEAIGRPGALLRRADARDSEV